MFQVRLYGHAEVRQEQLVLAETREEAEKIAIEDQGDHKWKYQGILDASITASAEPL